MFGTQVPRRPARTGGGFSTGELGAPAPERFEEAPPVLGDAPVLAGASQIERAPVQVDAGDRLRGSREPGLHPTRRVREGGDGLQRETPDEIRLAGRDAQCGQGLPSCAEDEPESPRPDPLPLDERNQLVAEDPSPDLRGAAGVLGHEDDVERADLRVGDARQSRE